MFIYFWERESREGVEREGDTESEAGSRLWAVSTEPNSGLELTSCGIMTKVGCSANWATQVPQYKILFKKIKNIKLVLAGAPGWLSRLSSGHDLTVREFEPRVGLCADSSEPGACFGFYVSLSLSDPPQLMLCLSLSQK